ncbi:HI1506-related protein [Nitrosomonas sp. Nm58]|uniref:HI1506-related protein n=1 Tax=Nitrosomonas sp. Nm58 TaxID=200126 RepID=UPI00089577D4|nr:HI1506-related protein [Nitrosomonas sp. Nm58]SDY24170.1 hypothetical protein SAMN05421754_100482 [Nitrosomonas sp. Nm58]
MAKTDKTTDPAAENLATPEIKTQDTVNKEKIKALRIRAFNDRFRRAGITFGKEDQVIPLADLTAEQIAQIKSEPMLAVSETEIDA